MAFQGGGLRLIPGYLVWNLYGQSHATTGFSLETVFSVANYYSTTAPCLYTSVLVDATQFRYTLRAMNVKMLMLMATANSDSEHTGGPNS